MSISKSLSLLVFLLIAIPALGADVEEQTISRDQWPAYVNGSNISNLPQVQRVLSQFDENGRFNIIIRYPGGDAGITWGKQLYRWFVAYGVPGSYLTMEPGSGAPDLLLLVLVNKS